MLGETEFTAALPIARQPSDVQKLLAKAATVDGARVQAVQSKHDVAIADIHEYGSCIVCAKAKRATVAREAATQDRAAVHVLEMVHEACVAALVAGRGGHENILHVPQTRRLVGRAQAQNTPHRVHG